LKNQTILFNYLETVTVEGWKATANIFTLQWQSLIDGFCFVFFKVRAENSFLTYLYVTLTQIKSWPHEQQWHHHLQKWPHRFQKYNFWNLLMAPLILFTKMKKKIEHRDIKSRSDTVLLFVTVNFFECLQF
jgi:hypothetical protein